MAQQQSHATWPALTSESKPWTRWWWLGSAVDRAGLTQALEAIAGVGLGGVEICPIYGAIGAESRFVQFLSADWVALLQHTVAEASRLGISVDLTTGTGWPFGGPEVSSEQASCKLVLSRFTVAESERFDQQLPRGIFEHAVAINAANEAVDLQVSDGRIQWTAPAGGPWQVVIAVRMAPIQQVKRAAPGGAGNVVDPYSITSLDHYLSSFDNAFAKTGWPKLHGQFHDSFEYFDADWTPLMLQEFQARRGYDLRPHLGALAGIGPVDIVARVKCDYRQTIGDLHLQYIASWKEWCHSKGGVAREQAHGAPANPIDVYAAADIPETEVFGPLNEQSLPMNKLASSAAHLAGRPVASSESFTWLGEHFQVTLADTKAEADYLFLSGINRLVFHGTAYSPQDIPWPGWLFYASTHFEPTAGLWRDLPAFTAYLSRCQSVLQSGRPSRDVLLYFPIYDFWQTPTVGKEMLIPFAMKPDRLVGHPFHAAAMTLWKDGYLFDEVSDHFIRVARYIDGGIDIGGTRYKTIVVPSCRVMPTETLSSLIDLAKAGATVIFQDLPDDVPGLLNANSRRAFLQKMLKDLTAGKLPIDQLLSQAKTPRESMADLGLMCERRSHDDGHSYLIVNRGKEPIDGWVPLGMPAQSAVMFDPRFEKRIGRAAMRRQSQIYLQLLPGESIVVQTSDANDLPGGQWPYSTAAGNPKAVEGRWQIEFIDGGPTLPEAFKSDHLGSWTDTADADAKRFAGTARYRVEFQHTDAVNVDDWQLDLGRVCESARVRINGHDAGTAWCAPFRLPIGQWLISGGNVLEIEVTNLAANRIADLDRRGVAWKRFHEINFVNKDYKTFDSSKWPLRDSGLLGPVQLLPTLRLVPV